MKKLMLATVSALALGLAGAGVGYAQQTPANPNPNANMTAPPPGTQTDQGTQMNQGQENTAQGAPVNLSASQIRQVQEQLKTAGLYKGAIDGRMGPETKEALQSFQQKNGLQATGTLDQQTMTALQSNNPTGSGGSAVNPGTAGQPATGGINNGQGDNSQNQPAGNNNPTGNNQR